MRTLPERPVAGRTYECDESRARPVVDSVAGVLAVAAVALVAVATVGCSDGTSAAGCSTVLVGFTWVPVAVALGLSARHGFVQANRCRAYHENRLPLLAEPVAAPAPDPEAVGRPCERIPGVERGGRCPRGLVCRGDTCEP
jgi:hypothetical protein